MFLIFDTETTGLPKNFKAPISDSDNWPRMVQLAWQLHDNCPTISQQLANNYPTINSYLRNNYSTIT